jgi:hypothetical protein
LKYEWDDITKAGFSQSLVSSGGNNEKREALPLSKERHCLGDALIAWVFIDSILMMNVRLHAVVLRIALRASNTDSHPCVHVCMKKSQFIRSCNVEM